MEKKSAIKLILYIITDFKIKQQKRRKNFYMFLNSSLIVQSSIEMFVIA